MDAQFRDDACRSGDVLTGPAPGFLSAEAPGQALVVGCGESDDVVWLARRGWLVTAVDPSYARLQRAIARSAGIASGSVAWARADVSLAPLPARSFDLVCVRHLLLPRGSGARVWGRLLAAVAPGGTLLISGTGAAQTHGEGGQDEAGFCQVSDVAELLDDRWSVVVHETRPQADRAGVASAHEAVLRARRLA
ncbi:class I SAM-dependent methyltransferase [Streptomyces sp. WAC04770]|nr:class I SAM-dependent methyltransferase [Streptomyces sp. WAC04770]